MCRVFCKSIWIRRYCILLEQHECQAHLSVVKWAVRANCVKFLDDTVSAENACRSLLGSILTLKPEGSCIRFSPNPSKAIRHSRNVLLGRRPVASACVATQCRQVMKRLTPLALHAPVQ